MKKEIIINASKDRARIAIVEDGQLAELYVEHPDNVRTLGNIYLGKVAKVMGQIHAAFVDIGQKQDAFLHFSDLTENAPQLIAMAGEHVPGLEAPILAKAPQKRVADDDDEPDVDETLEVEDAADESNTARTGRSRSRRRRRGGRGRRGGRNTHRSEEEEEQEERRLPHVIDLTAKSGSVRPTPAAKAEVTAKPEAASGESKAADAAPEAEKPKRTRSRAKKKTEEASGDTPETTDAPDTGEKPKRTRSRTKKDETPEADEKPKRTRSRKKKVEDAPESAEGDAPEADAAEATPKPKRTRSRKKKETSEEASGDDAAQTPEADEKPKRTRSRSKKKTDDTDSSEADAPTGRTRTPKQEKSDHEKREANEDSEPTANKPKRTRTRKKKDDASGDEPKATKKDTPTRSRSRSKKDETPEADAPVAETPVAETPEVKKAVVSHAAKHTIDLSTPSRPRRPAPTPQRSDDDDARGSRRSATDDEASGEDSSRSRRRSRSDDSDASGDATESRGRRSRSESSDETNSTDEPRSRRRSRSTSDDDSSNGSDSRRRSSKDDDRDDARGSRRDSSGRFKTTETRADAPDASGDDSPSRDAPRGDAPREDSSREDSSRSRGGRGRSSERRSDDGGRAEETRDRGRNNGRGGRSGNSRNGGGQKASTWNGKAEDLLSRGSRVLVKITKEPISAKGSRVSTDISLAGRFLVLVPAADYVAVSKKIESSKERRRLRALASSLKPANCGVIVRTVAGGQDAKALDQDLRLLIAKWNKIEAKLDGGNATPPILLHEDVDMVSSIIRDLFSEDFDRILVDDPHLHRKLQNYVKAVSPDMVDKVQMHRSNQPVFKAVGIEKQVEEAFSERVNMKGGGYLIIEHTEAMHVVDVNSGRAGRGKRRAEENLLAVNLESAREIGRQLRLRDLGGIICVDFIDLRHDRDRRKVTEAIKKEFAKDRAVTKVIGMSDFGVMQITRQRLRPSITAQDDTDGMDAMEAAGATEIVQPERDHPEPAPEVQEAPREDTRRGPGRQDKSTERQASGGGRSRRPSRRAESTPSGDVSPAQLAERVRDWLTNYRDSVDEKFARKPIVVSIHPLMGSYMRRGFPSPLTRLRFRLRGVPFQVVDDPKVDPLSFEVVDEKSGRPLRSKYPLDEA